MAQHQPPNVRECKDVQAELLRCLIHRAVQAEVASACGRASELLGRIAASGLLATETRSVRAGGGRDE
jgi:hypothetical protein